MNLLSRIFMAFSAILLVALITLRIAAPEIVVNQPSGFFLSIGWATMLFLGLAEWKGLSVGAASAGRPITVISALLAAGATDFLLGLGFFAKSQSNQILALFFSIVTAIMFFAWWKILCRGERK